MEFEELREMAQVLTRNKVKQVEILGNPGQDGSRAEALYDGIVKGKFKNDDEAAKHFFGKKANSKDVGYRRLRVKLIRMLINTSFFVDLNQPMFNERYKAYYNCRRDAAAAYLMATRGIKKASIYILEQTLEHCIKFEFIDMVCDITNDLIMIYGGNLSDTENIEYYKKIKFEFEEKRSLENKSKQYADESYKYYGVQRSPNPEVFKLASQYFEELDQIDKTKTTYQFRKDLHRLNIVRYFAQGDYRGALQVLENIIPEYETNPYTYRSELLFYLINALSCCIQLRLWEPAEKYANSLPALTDVGNNLWYQIKEVFMYHHLYQKQYPEAYNHFKEALQHPRFELISGTKRDDWFLFGGYMHLLAQFGVYKQEDIQAVAGPFKYFKFVNEIGIFDKDKIGMNIALVLLPVWFGLAKGEEGDANKSLDALEKYRQRYLDNDLNRRSAIMVRLLSALIKRPYDKDRNDRKIEKELVSLRENPPETSLQMFYLEILPYEDLWNLLVEKLGLVQHKV
jgi:hypothetical protein